MQKRAQELVDVSMDPVSFGKQPLEKIQAVCQTVSTSSSRLILLGSMHVLDGTGVPDATAV